MEIQYLTGSNGNVCCVVNGWCNHADYEVGEHDFGGYSPVHDDWIDDWSKVLVCRKCGAWQDMERIMDGVWYDEGNEYEREEQATARSIEFWSKLDA